MTARWVVADRAVTAGANAGVMRLRPHLLPLLCAAFAAPAIATGLALAAGPATETVYVQGHTAEINTGAAVKFDTSAGLLAHASPIFIIGFPVAPGTTGPITLPSGYQPQHNGFPPSPIPYHDHVITSTPGAGGEPYAAPRRVVAMRYAAAYTSSPTFTPITSADQIPAAEAAGKLEPVAPGAPDPYQDWTTTVLVRPVIEAP